MEYSNEVWKNVIGYENAYEISNFGRVRSKRYNRFIRGGTTSGYLFVVLCEKNKKKTFRISRLVAIHFLINSNNLSEVNHKDGNKQNNNVTNLEWCSGKENRFHSAFVLKKSIIDKPVFVYTLDKKLIDYFETKYSFYKSFGGHNRKDFCATKDKIKKYINTKFENKDNLKTYKDRIFTTFKL